MSELPKCKLCGADAAMHKVFGGIKYCCSSETCTMHDVLMLKNQWRTLMAQQQAEPSQVPTGHVYLPEITPEMWETLGDTDVMTWIDGPQWTQIAVDFASMLPVKMPAQPAPIPTSERLPTEVDADCDGRVFVWMHASRGKCWLMTHWLNARHGDYWLPTGLTMPPAPTTKENINAKDAD